MSPRSLQEESSSECAPTPPPPLLIEQVRNETKREDPNWGFPGYLTSSELDVYNQFKVFVEKEAEYKSTVCSFGEQEEECFALCRWLRARKFVIEDVKQMVREATEMRAEAKLHNFYPDAERALGVCPTVFIKQFPQVYMGCSKEGHPVFISKPGQLNTHGLECITTIDGILRYHWYEMMHNFKSKLVQSVNDSEGKYKRFESVCVVDLSHLSASSVTKRALNIVKTQSQVDSLCFPETLNRMIIVNAPSFFTMTWKLIKSWVDIRTANKVEVYGTSRKRWEKRLLEIIDASQLPSDYGGLDISTDQAMLQSLHNSVHHNICHQASVRGNHTFSSFEIRDDQQVEIIVHTRSLYDAIFTVQDLHTNKVITKKRVKHLGKGSEEEEPTRVTLKRITGPMKFVINVRCASKLHSHHYVVEGNVITLNDANAVDDDDDVVDDEKKDNDSHTQSTKSSSNDTTDELKDFVEIELNSIGVIGINNNIEAIKSSKRGGKRKNKSAKGTKTCDNSNNIKNQSTIDVQLTIADKQTCKRSSEKVEHDAAKQSILKDEGDDDDDFLDTLQFKKVDDSTSLPQTGWSCGAVSFNNIFGCNRF